jgi:hypothetical protein
VIAGARAGAVMDVLRMLEEMSRTMGMNVQGAHIPAP